MDNLTPEEKQVRLKKADSIRRMLAEQTSTGSRNAGKMSLNIYLVLIKVFRSSRCVFIKVEMDNS